MTSTIYIVDDDPAMRDALSMLIEEHGWPVVACASAEEFLEVVRPGAGCAIVDLRMPGMDGMELQQHMAQQGIQLPIVMLTGHGDIPTSVKAMKAGAVDFLTKPVAANVVVDSVRSAIARGQRAYQEAQAARDIASLVASLTGREREVMSLTAEGRPNKDIARLLGISHRTVEIHRARVMHKLGVRTPLELAKFVLHQ